jgi:UDP-GlcNAc:undecaprenyl-phosphate GlcNAc-1-phosphate transferase
VSAPVLVVLALVGSIGSSWLVTKLGGRFGLVDRPGAIKPHLRPVPYLGGTAILVPLVVAVPIVALSPFAVGGAVLCWLVGIVDDVRGLTPVLKLVSLLPALGLGSFAMDLPPIHRVLVVVVGLVLLNVFNVIDGLDALAGGTAVLLFVSLALLGPMPHLSAVAVGATLGFLVFNLPPAKLFLGDEGSLLLGYLLWLFTTAWLAPSPVVLAAAVWSLLWLFPLANAAYVIAVRIRARRPLLRGDRSHLYDALNRRYGLTRTLLICWLMSTLGALGVAALVHAG